MNTKEVADLIGTTPDTLRRWASQDYTAFLSPGATPPKGDDRRFNEHDLRVLNYVSTSRDTGMPHDKIRATLTDMRSDGWKDLGPIPDEWTKPPADGRIAMSEAGEQAQQIARITALEMQVVNLRERLDEALERAEKAERELENLRAMQNTTDAQMHTAELELERAKGQVSALEARLSAYAITGGDNPIPVAVIVVVTALVAVAVVILVFVVARLLL